MVGSRTEEELYSYYFVLAAFNEVGGYEKLLDDYWTSEPDPEYAAFYLQNGQNVSCSKVKPDFAHLFHSIDDTFLPWTGVMTGMFIASISYWCTDQVSSRVDQNMVGMLLGFTKMRWK